MLRLLSPAVAFRARRYLDGSRWPSSGSIREDASSTASRLTPVSMPRPSQHVEQILGRKVPGRAGRVRAAAQSARGRVERRDAEIECGQHVGQRGAARVVKVQRERDRPARDEAAADRTSRTWPGWATPIVSLTAT